MNYPFSGIIVRFSGASAARASGVVLPADPGEAGSSKTHKVEPKNQVHANLWELGGRRFLDVGIMIDAAEREVDEVAVELPWPVREGEVFDLGAKLDGDRILTAIFNEVVHYSGESGNDFATVTIDPEKGDDNKFVIVRLHSSSFDITSLNLPNRTRTTRLIIKTPNDGRNLRRYIRFRIVDIPLAVYTSVFSPTDRTVLSSSVQTRIFDFRINVRRGIPDDVLAGGEKWRFPRFDRIHLFAILARGREISYEGDTFKACRSLEDEDVWNSYVNLSDTGGQSFKAVHDYLGYQWTAGSKESGAKDLAALARFTSVDSSGFNIGRFLILGLLLGALASGIWEFLKWYFEKNFVKLDSKEVAPSGVYQDFPLMVVIACAIIVLVIASPKRIVALYELCKRGIKRALRFVGSLLIEK